MRTSWFRGSAAVAMAAALVACERAFLHEPAPIGSASLTLDVGPSSSAGPADAFDKVDQAWVQLLDGERVRLETTFSIQPLGQNVALPLEVPMRRPTETLVLRLELRRGSGVVFRGSTNLALRIGRSSGVPLAVDPVAHALVLPATYPTLTAYGDTVLARGATVFVTGDTLSVGNVEWTSLDPQVIAVVRSVPIAIGDGDARLVGRIGTLADTLDARVFATVHAIEIDPAVSQLAIGESRRYVARLFDRKGNPILGRTVSWRSSDPAVVEVDAAGEAVGRSVGDAHIIAESGDAASDLLVRTLPGSPSVVTDTVRQVTSTTAMLHGMTRTNGAPTDLWFVYARDTLFSNPRVTARVSVAAGLSESPDSISIGGLSPGTTYYVRAFVTNAAGSGQGGIMPFTTALTTLQVTTGGVTQLTSTQVTLFGTVVPSGLPADVWVEWHTDESLSSPFRTPIQQVTGGSQLLGTTLGGLVPGLTYFYRYVARDAGGTVFGKVLSFRITASGGPAPTAVTLAASAIRPDTAALNATVNPNGVPASAWFEWGTDPALATFTATDVTAVGSGTSPQAVAHQLGPLSPSTTYYFRVAATNGGGVAKGAIMSFTTLPPGGGSPQAPTVTTFSATPVWADSAALNGLVNPNGVLTSAYFEWGTHPTLASSSTTPAQNVGAGSSGVGLTALLEPLTPNTTYYYRVVASNAGGASQGAILSFRTGSDGMILPPTSSTNSAGPVRADTVALNGTVDPNGAATLAWFQWGASPTLSTFVETAKHPVGSGTSGVAVLDLLTTVTEGTTYYFRVAASNAGGVSVGAIQSFTPTSSAPGGPPSATTLPPTGVSLTSATMNGSVNANGEATVYWFEYSTDPTFATFQTTTVRSAGSGGAVGVSEPIPNVIEEAFYYYRVVAFSSKGTAFGAILSFKAL